VFIACAAPRWTTTFHASLIEERRTELEALCLRHRVRCLEVFGSATEGTFDSERSDLDFLVDYLPLESGKHADAYFGLLFDLEALFDRKIDLVMTTAITNPYFREAIDRQRQVLYAA